jgi:plastocyanin
MNFRPAMTFTDKLSLAKWRCTVFTIAGFIASLTVSADEIEVTVLDRDGNPVSDVAVYLDGGVADQSSVASGNAVMDQIDTRFDPHFLIIQAGTSVDFPNSDFVAHHVYSFSSPNNFMLPLYKGDLHPPVKFEHSGVVTLGCNIHDHMLAYILVVDSQVFSTTDKDGKAYLNVNNPDGQAVHIWSPRFRPDDISATQTLAADGPTQMTFLLTEKLRARHDAGSNALAWKKY